MYRLCGERDKPISHVTSECKKIAQLEAMPHIDPPNQG